ncbi:hypothetical protein BCR39DRAFT_511370 [Naematelia encephala]|uniref:Polysaccharide lyase 14 domain-containing protein n=1 Tax=Naematelia encephala TaxID=71784 RepID=A0A1Y2BLW0_9TREE|nr:hypothetical protein BCR39DRAFT_511370 [Naematelia encephala]
MSPLTTSILIILVSLIPRIKAVTLQSVIANYSLTAASYNFSVPTTTLDSDDAVDWIKDNWALTGIISFGTDDIVFSPDPSTSTSTLVRRDASSTTSSASKSSSSSKLHKHSSSASSSSSPSSSSTSSTSTSATSVSSPASTNLAGEPPVLRINYPQGSYSHGTGGTQFYATPLSGGNSDTYERMLLSYDIWFPTGFAWNQGGKLPGLRGGPDSKGCSGGNETDGSTCFSSRLMWRTQGEGEVYAYIPTSTSLCKDTNIICNSDYGTSLSRGSFTFASGQWQTVWLLVVLNTVGTADGIVELWYNGVQALQFTNLELRSAESLASIGGMYFSTFFGGDDSSWATPTSQYTYFRNMQLYAGQGASNLTGDKIAAGVQGVSTGNGIVLAIVAILLAAIIGVHVGM